MFLNRNCRSIRYLPSCLFSVVQIASKSCSIMVRSSSRGAGCARGIGAGGVYAGGGVGI